MKCPDRLRRGAVRGGLLGLALSIGGWGLVNAQPAERLKLTLEEGLRLAAEKDEKLLIAQTELRRSRAQLRRVRADAFPHFSASVNYGRNWLLPTAVFSTASGPQRVEIGSAHALAGALGVEQSLAVNRQGTARAAARLGVEYSAEVERQVRQQLVAEVEKRFCDLLLAQELAEVSALSLERASVDRERAQSLRQAGRISDYEVLRTEVQVATLRSDSIRVRNELNMAEEALRDAVRLEGDLEATGEFREESRLSLNSLEKLLELGRARRPEMRQADCQFRMQECAVRLKQQEQGPAVGLFASGQVQFQSDKIDLSRGDAWRKSWTTGLSMQIPLEGMRAGAELEQARLERERLQFEKAQVEREIRLEIRRVWAALQDAGERLAIQRGVVERAEKNLWFAESRYSSGVGTQLEVLDAQVTLAEAQTTYATTRHDRALALVELERAVGVLGEPAAAEELSQKE